MLRPQLTARWVQYSASTFLRALIGHNSKVWVTFGWVSIPPPAPSLPSDPYERAFVPDILSLDFIRPGVLWPKLDIDHVSHVSFYASIASMLRLYCLSFYLRTFLALPFGIRIKLLWPSLPPCG